MREVDRNYFSSISKLVNEKAYNTSLAGDYKPLHFDPLDDVSCSYVKSSILSDGFSIIQIMNEDSINQAKVTAILQAIFGKPFKDKNLGKQAYAKVQAEDNAKFYINSHLAQPIHTDEGHTAAYPRYVAIYCSLQAQSGGESIVVPFKPLYTALIKHFGDDIDLLLQQDAVTVKNVYGIEKKPILLILDNNEIGISYSPVLQKMWCTHQVFELFDYITRYVHNRDNQLRFKLKSGQALLLDNCKALHGRTLFAQDEKRLLYRYWYESCIL